MTPSDLALPSARPDIAEAFLASMAEAYAQGTHAAEAEAAVIARPRDFRLADITVPVHLFQGGFDPYVPPSTGNWLAGEIPVAVLHECPGEGHLSIVWNRFEECLAVLS